MLQREDAEQLGAAACGLVFVGDDVGGGAVGAGLLDGALRLEVIVLQPFLAVLREVGERGEQRVLFVVIVVALRPGDDGQRRILLVPGAGVLVRREDALLGIGAAVAEGLVEAADAVVHGG